MDRLEYIQNSWTSKLANSFNHQIHPIDPTEPPPSPPRSVLFPLLPPHTSPTDLPSPTRVMPPVSHPLPPRAQIAFLQPVRSMEQMPQRPTPDYREDVSEDQKVGFR